MKDAVKRRIVVVTVIAILLLFGGIAWVIPYLHPIKVTVDIFTPYHYTVFKDSVELNEYKGKSTEVVIPETLWGRTVTSIGSNCFEENEEIKKVVIPDSVSRIVGDSFESCISLEEIEGGKNVMCIGVTAFRYCTNLKDVGALGEKVEVIEVEAFRGCSSLNYFPFTENLKQIDVAAFKSSGIAKVDEVSSVEYLEECIFSGTPWLEQQEEDFVIYNDILIAYKGQEKKVVIPEGVKGIAVSFADTEGIEEIYVPSSVEYIRQGCLTFCKGIRIYIPKEVEKIGYEVCYDGRIELRSIDHSSENGSGNVIVTTAGSPAEAHAKEFGIPCEIVEGW